MIKLPLLSAVVVQFKQPIFEDDFVETGMTAWLTKVEWDNKMECYKLHFDFKDFEADNDKYFTACFYPNIHTKKLEEETGRCLFTAIEANQYCSKHSVYFSITGDVRDDEKFTKEITEYLTVLIG